jgi:hypothetical protein
MSEEFNPKTVVPNYSANMNVLGEYSITFSKDAANRNDYVRILGQIINEIDHCMKLKAGIIQEDFRAENLPIHMRFFSPSEEPCVHLKLKCSKEGLLGCEYPVK